MSGRFADLIGSVEGLATWGAGSVVGLEHEYRVVVDGRTVDFRTLVHRLGLGQHHLDPGDPNAYRLPSGAALTADEAEAEIAFAPFGAGPHLGTRMAESALRERIALESRLPGLGVVQGYSTHLSVSVPSALGARLARLYAVTFSLALMLLIDRPDSPGLLIRPRPGRLELGGEFVEGGRLSIAALFALASVRACLRHIEDHRAELPLPLKARVVADDHRYGWFVARDAFGIDLYRVGRGARVRLANGGSTGANDHLRTCWRIARSTLAPDTDASELTAVDDVVDGPDPLPSASIVSSPCPRAVGEEPTAAAFGLICQPQRRPDFELAPVMVTWDRVVLVAADLDRTRRAFVSVPGPRLVSFCRLLRAGRVDEVLGSYLAHPPTGRRLSGRADQSAGLFDELAPRASLLSRERQVSPRARIRAAALRHRPALARQTSSQRRQA